MNVLYFYFVSLVIKRNMNKMKISEIIVYDIESIYFRNGFYYIYCP